MASSSCSDLSNLKHFVLKWSDKLRDVVDGDVVDGDVEEKLLAMVNEISARALGHVDQAIGSVVAVVGERGHGKSTLINSVIGVELLPTGSFSATTAAVTEVSAWARDGYEIYVVAISSEEWRSRMDEAVDIISSGKQEHPDVDTLADLLGKLDSLHRDLLQGREEELAAVLKSARLPGETPVDEARDLFLNASENGFDEDQKAFLVDARFHYQYATEDVQALVADVAKFARKADRMEDESQSDLFKFWPLVDRIFVRGPFPRLIERSVSLLDVPGTGDGSAASVARHMEALRSATNVLVTRPPETLNEINKIKELVRFYSEGDKPVDLVVTKVKCPEKIQKRIARTKDAIDKEFGLGNVNQFYMCHSDTLDSEYGESDDGRDFFVDPFDMTTISGELFASLCDGLCPETMTDIAGRVAGRINTDLRLYRASFDADLASPRIAELFQDPSAFCHLQTTSPAALDVAARLRECNVWDTSAHYRTLQLVFEGRVETTFRVVCNMVLHRLSWKLLKDMIIRHVTSAVTHLREEETGEELATSIVAFVTILIKDLGSASMLYYLDPKRNHDVASTVHASLSPSTCTTGTGCQRAMAKELGRVVSDLQLPISQALIGTVFKFIGSRVVGMLATVSSVVKTTSELRALLVENAFLSESSSLRSSAPSQLLRTGEVVFDSSASSLQQLVDRNPEYLSHVDFTFSTRTIKSGHVYVVRNGDHDGNSDFTSLFKVGCTTRPVAVRAKELMSAAVVRPVKVELDVETLANYKLEAFIHRLLGPCRLQVRREFFQAPLALLEQVVRFAGNLVNDAVLNDRVGRVTCSSREV